MYVLFNMFFDVQGIMTKNRPSDEKQTAGGISREPPAVYFKSYDNFRSYDKCVRLFHCDLQGRLAVGRDCGDNIDTLGQAVGGEAAVA